MHPQIIRNEPGNCPICGMTLVKKTEDDKEISGVDLNTLLLPTNSFVISSVPLTATSFETEPVNINAFGYITYDTRGVGAISSRVSGRIEKLYVKYRFQKIARGQKIMDIYSPELVTDQQNLLFLLKNDPSNASLINAAKQRLLLSGISSKQLDQVIKNGRPAMAISIYSPYGGHIHEAGTDEPMVNAENKGMGEVIKTTEWLSLREGMYIRKGQNVFSVYNPAKAWAILNIYADRQSQVRPGSTVNIIPEITPHQNFRAAISFIEPYFRENSKTVTVRVDFDNSRRQLPIGSKVSATIFVPDKKAFWLPAQAVLLLGMDRIVFLKRDGVFQAHKIETGLTQTGKIEVLSGLAPEDSVAANAQFLMDSESFIKLK